MNKKDNSPAGKLERNIKTLIKNYYLPHNQLYLEKLRTKHFSTLLKKEQDYINRLEKRFQQLVIARNALAKKNKFENYFDFINNQNSVPENKLKLFFDNAYGIGKWIVNNLPTNIKESEWFDGTRYGFDLSHLSSKTKYKLPDDIKNFLLTQKDINPKYLKKIKLVNSRGMTFYTSYNYKNATAKIYFDKNHNNASGAKLLTHEYGHAIEMLKGLEKNSELKYPKAYPDEERAIKLEMRFVKSLRGHDKKISSFGNLYHFVNTFFENEIYKNPKQDFAKIYAQIQDELFGKKNRTGKDSTYLLNSFLVEYPCYSTIYSVIYTDFYTNE